MHYLIDSIHFQRYVQRNVFVTNISLIDKPLSSGGKPYGTPNTVVQNSAERVQEVGDDVITILGLELMKAFNLISWLLYNLIF